MADSGDKVAAKLARREFNRHLIDVTMADIRVSNGVVYVRGTIQAQKSAHYSDVEEECERIIRILKQRPEIRDVAFDVTYKKPYL